MTQDNDSNAPDAHLPALTADLADHLRRLVADDLSARDGVRPQVDGATAVRERSSHNLTILAQRCGAEAPEHWPALIALHFTSLDAVAQGGESAEELLRRTVLRLLPAEALTGDVAAGHRYAWQPADGLVTALALDAPDSVRMLTDAERRVRRPRRSEGGRPGEPAGRTGGARGDPYAVGRAAALGLRRLPLRGEQGARPG
ncbi:MULTISPECIES: hypothetical protein [unclassified Streptomyces]|uniref:hypothetical protein n=1 Tax=unclassified Streptomyces TaxID=2593676 RepID=UPI0024A81E9B|nr:MULTISPECIES: hypothetical protein [unclassified Streptomyces]